MELKLGDILEGRITGMTNFGAFVDLGENKSGMVHISEVADTFVRDIRDHLETGQTVRVRVISVGDDGKIGLSIKKAAEKPEKQRPRQNDSPGRPGSFEWRSPKTEQASFEEMMQKFKQTSNEKISGMKKSVDSRRSGGYSRKNSGH
ncbi:MAG: S1 RNA-binding domain-containing protein [Clostridia bacterium]|nr:S1 RNA-binding domain-containing protein [Clostridia bacterium]